MITNEQIPEVLEHPVYDTGGSKIGEAKHVFLDDTTGQPEWVSVKTGLFGSKESFVPVRDASVVQDHLEVPYTKDKVKDAPNVDVDAGGHLSEEEEHRLYDFYSLRWAESAHTPTETGRGPRPAAVGDSDDAMTRSEEQMHVGTERQQAGRARLRKYVVTEEQQQTVPVRREEVRVEREPITEENRGAALSGPDIAEGEYEVTLHEERPVVETRAEPVERVRLTTEEHTEQRTVRGDVRKEEIEEEITERPEDRPR
jgi:uncharacterized protein (TIGR02271 family)